MTQSPQTRSGREIETERLLLRPFTRADGEMLFSLYGDARVMSIRKIGPQTRAQSEAQLLEIVSHWRRRGFGLWAVLEKTSGAFIGECGLREIAAGGPEIELSYGLLPETWGRGLGSEAARAALAFGLEVAGLRTIYAIARADNGRSRRLMEKLGFKFEKEWAAGEKRVVRYVISS
jgi:ribosomal-protein-alanine N-acetyltransferase